MSGRGRSVAETVAASSYQSDGRHVPIAVTSVATTPTIAIVRRPRRSSDASSTSARRSAVGPAGAESWTVTG
ncbi:hypothetical protein GCM10009722_17370 [Williamsia deligens]